MKEEEEEDPAPLFAACGSAPFTLITQLGGLILPLSLSLSVERGAKELKGERGGDGRH